MADETPDAGAALPFAGSRRILNALTSRPLVLYPLAGGMIAAIGILDYLTGDEVLLFIGHLLPVALLAWGAGLYAGLAGAFVSAGAVLVTYVAVGEAVRPIYVSHTVVSLISSAAVAWAVSRVRADTLKIMSLLAVERRLAREDPLTGLPSARAFHERMTLEIERMKRHARPLSLLFLDLDDFKRVNDERGHQAGDTVLVRVARILESHVRKVDLCARLGGDEFAVLMPETSPADALAVSERVREALTRPFQEGGASMRASLGLATFEKPPIDAAAPLSLADGLMYEAKRAGKDRVSSRVFS